MHYVSQLYEYWAEFDYIVWEHAQDFYLAKSGEELPQHMMSS